eukprot:Colp12_sorted_trinity150504_noHs@25011
MASTGSVYLDKMIAPIFLELLKVDPPSMNAVREVLNRFEDCERAVPGFAEMFLKEFLQAEKIRDVEKKLEKFSITAKETKPAKTATSPDDDSYVMPHVQLLAYKLSTILSTISSQIHNRDAFLTTIKDVAATIKELLELVNLVLTNTTSRKLSAEDIKVINDRKKTYILASKAFSETLRNWFAKGNTDEVIGAANSLVDQTNLMVAAVYTSS